MSTEAVFELVSCTGNSTGCEICGPTYEEMDYIEYEDGEFYLHVTYGCYGGGGWSEKNWKDALEALEEYDEFDADDREKIAKRIRALVQAKGAE